MPSTTDPHLLDHQYDGIREYDNPVPGWWHWILWLTVGFCVLYFIFFQFSPDAWTIQDSWEREQADAYRRVFGTLGELQPDEPTIVKLKGDQRMMSLARSMFVGNCAQCHGRDAGGITGVNLTDDSYKNVRALLDIYTVITKGANHGAMPAWENRLSTNERILMASYAASLRGTNVPGGKAAEGNVIAPWPTTPDAPAAAKP